MNRDPIILTLTLSLFAGSAAWAQDDQQPASSPVPAFGQDNPAPTVSENPPISGIDQPGLEPHAAPQSFLLPGLHFSESVDSNVGNTLGGSSVSAVSTALGSLTLQKLWRNYQVAMDYVGGVSYYDLQVSGFSNCSNWTSTIASTGSAGSWQSGIHSAISPKVPSASEAMVAVGPTTRASEARVRVCWEAAHSEDRPALSWEATVCRSPLGWYRALRIQDWSTSSRS